MKASGFGGEDIVRDYIAKYSNWRRWGEDDQLGALNYVGPEQIKAAAGLVRQGKVVSMSLPYDLFGPQVGAFRANPLNLMTATGTDYLSGHQDPLPADWGPAYTFGFADDVIVMPNQAGTQWDSLGHIFFEGKMYNGFDAGLVSAKGAERCSIVAARERFIMRGVLLDVAQGRRGARTRIRRHGRRSRCHRFRPRCRDPQRRLHHPPDGPARPAAGEVGRLLRRPGSRILVAHRPVAGRARSGGHRHRHVGLRGPPQRNRAVPAAPHRGARPHGHSLRGDLGSRAHQRRLRG
jgi:hypothetical protein